MRDPMLFLAYDRMRDFERQARRERLAREVNTPETGAEPVHRRSLAWAGRRLIRLGNALETRFGTPVLTAQPEPCD